MATDSPDSTDGEHTGSSSQRGAATVGDAASRTAVSAAELTGIATADSHEAAAIAAAIGAHLHDQAAAAAGADSSTEPTKRSWRFAGRLAAVGRQSNRPPTTTPTNDWSASGRADRF